MPVIAVIAPGAMGAAVGARLVEHGAEVWTVLSGRSQVSAARARKAGMQSVDAQRIGEAEIVLSIVPPGSALALARSLAPVLRDAVRKPVYADCNALSPQTTAAVATELCESGAPFVDACIIGAPPGPGIVGPSFYISGPDAPALAVLSQYGLQVKDLHGPVGAASGLKMSYAGITKGLTALASAMMLAATRFGAAPALAAELAASQPDLLKYCLRSVPDMYPRPIAGSRKCRRLRPSLARTSQCGKSITASRHFMNVWRRMLRDQSRRLALWMPSWVGPDLRKRGWPQDYCFR